MPTNDGSKVRHWIYRTNGGTISARFYVLCTVYPAAKNDVTFWHPIGVVRGKDRIAAMVQKLGSEQSDGLDIDFYRHPTIDNADNWFL